MNNKKLTKKEVLKQFNQEIKPNLKHQDKIALSEAWNNYIDSLQKDGYLTEKQVSTWTNPF